MPDPVLQTPPDLAKSGPEPMIFAMPERYRDGAVGTVIAEPKPEAPKVVPKPVLPPPPPPKPLPPKPVPPPAHAKPHGKIAVLVGTIVLLGLGIGGFFLFRSLNTPKPSTPVTTPETQPTPPVVEAPPTPPAVTETAPTPATTSPFEGTALHPGVDSDSDGLTDVEETVVYNTDPRLPDSDGDGFLDGNEVFNLYNPKLPPPSTLRDAGVTKPFSTSLADGSSLPYAVDYPSAWMPKAVATDPLGVAFDATTGETVTITVSPKTAPGQTLSAWYAAQALPATGRPATTKGGLEMITSEDQLTVYVDAKTSVLTMKYSAGIKGAIDYLTTFKMMQNSLKVK